MSQKTDHSLSVNNPQPPPLPPLHPHSVRPQHQLVVEEVSSEVEGTLQPLLRLLLQPEEDSLDNPTTTTRTQVDQVSLVDWEEDKELVLRHLNLRSRLEHLQRTLRVHRLRLDCLGEGGQGEVCSETVRIQRERTREADCLGNLNSSNSSSKLEEEDCLVQRQARIRKSGFIISMVDHMVEKHERAGKS